MGKHILYHGLFGKRVILSEPMTLAEIRKLKGSLAVQVDGRKVPLKTIQLDAPSAKRKKPSSANSKVISRAKKKASPNVGSFTNAQIKQFEKNIEKAALSIEPWATKMFHEIVDMIKKYPPGYALGKVDYLWKQPAWIIPSEIKSSIEADVASYHVYLKQSKQRITAAQMRLLDKEIKDLIARKGLAVDINFLKEMRSHLKDFPATDAYKIYWRGETASREKVPRSIYKRIIGA